MAGAALHVSPDEIISRAQVQQTAAERVQKMMIAILHERRAAEELAQREHLAEEIAAEFEVLSVDGQVSEAVVSAPMLSTVPCCPSAADPG